MVQYVTFFVMRIGGFRRYAEHQKYDCACGDTGGDQGDMVTEKRQGGDTEQALDERDGGKERPDRFPLVAEQEVDRGQAASLDAHFVAGLADHRGREHNPSGCRQHSHYQRYQRQGEPAAFEQAVHSRDQACGQADLDHRGTNYVNQEQKGRQ